MERQTVSLEKYWINWMDKIIKARIRLSRAEIVREGLKSIKYSLDRELEEVLQVQAEIKERHEE